MSTVKVNASKKYDVVIEEGILDRIGEKCLQLGLGSRAVIVTDDIVAPLYLERAVSSLEKSGIKTESFVFKNGEESKNFTTLVNLLEFMAQKKITRSDFLVALGGGVTGDTAGFAAGIYQRGIRFVQVPTTLLAAVDSSVGGKTAVDLENGKNLAGVFWQPEGVFCDIRTLDTLSDEIFSQGMAEVIKYGVIFDSELFRLVKENDAKENIEKIITRCVELKRDVVEKDERDSGERQLLNFGHTIGHAVEKCSDFNISHGQAVAIGMMIISSACESKGLCENITKELSEILDKYSLKKSTEFSPEKLNEYALSDKKSDGEYMNIILPEKIGRCYINRIHKTELLSFIESGIKNGH